MQLTVWHHTPATQQPQEKPQRNAAQTDTLVCSLAGQHAAQMDSLFCSLAGQQAAQANPLACSFAGHMRNTGQPAAQADSLACSYSGPPCALSSLQPTTTMAPQTPVADRQQYTTPVRLPQPPLSVPQQVKVSTFIQQLRHNMNRLRSTPASRYVSPGTSIHKDLPNCTHVFLRQDGVRRSLQPPYSGPNQVISRSDKTFTIVVRDRHTTVSTDRVKPAYFIQDDLPDVSHPTLQTSAPPSTSNSPSQLQSDIKPPSSSPDPSLDKPKTTRSGQKVHFPARFLT